MPFAEVNIFGPMNDFKEIEEYVYMTVEEYETIRLMDLEGLNYFDYNPIGALYLLDSYYKNKIYK